ncbi:ABC transporter permease [Specibacter cremeus]|uniref:ABC transporter permease n=1 Tax=Specibacter cremeus TaxID=1629051 RepID=UPI000F794C1D|nr:ABC transporter permease [Specibacter cremeus]
MSAITTTDRVSLDRRVPAAGGLNPTFVRIEIKRLMRNKRTVIFTLLMPAVFFLLFGLSNKDQHLPNGQSYGGYILISLAVYGAMTAATAAGSMVAVERALGWSRQLRLTPLQPAAYIAVKAISSLSLALLSVVTEFLVGAAFGIRMEWQIWLVAGLVAWLGSLTFAALGLFMGYLVPSANVMQLLGPILAVLAMLGGLFVPISVMGKTFGDIAKFVPTYGLGQLARSPLTGDFDWMWIVNVVVWLAVFTIGSALAFRRDTKRV